MHFHMRQMGHNQEMGHDQAQARHLVRKHRQEFPSELVPKIEPSYRKQRNRRRRLARVRMLGNNRHKGHSHVDKLEDVTHHVHVVDEQ